MGLPKDQILESRTISFSSSTSTISGESACRNASHSTNVLIALATNNLFPELDCTRNWGLRFTDGAKIFSALSPGKVLKSEMISREIAVLSHVFVVAAVKFDEAKAAPATTPVFKKSRLE